MIEVNCVGGRGNMSNKCIYFYTRMPIKSVRTSFTSNAFSNLGYKIVSSSQEATIALINTCTVTENGDADTRRLVRKLVLDNSTIQIALIGCQSQVHKDELLSLPNVKWVVEIMKK